MVSSDGQPRKLGRVIAMIVVIALVLLVTLSASYYDGMQADRIITSSLNSSQSSSGPSQTTQSSSSLISSTSLGSAALATCSNSSGNGDYAKLDVSTDSWTVLCIEMHYYNPVETYALNVSEGLFIEGFQYSRGTQTVFNGGSNFTVITSPETLVLGGPNNQNEGTMIAYALAAKPGASGTYELTLSYLGTTYLGNEVCGSYGYVVAGNGEPSYLDQGFSGCTATTVSFASGTPTNSSEYTVIDGNVFRNGNLYFQIAGEMSSVQLGAGS